jgi:hypothetical protein
MGVAMQVEVGIAALGAAPAGAVVGPVEERVAFDRRAADRAGGEGVGGGCGRGCGQGIGCAAAACLEMMGDGIYGGAYGAVVRAGMAPLVLADDVSLAVEDDQVLCAQDAHLGWGVLGHWINSFAL